MNATSRLRRYSFATTTGALTLCAFARAAANFDLRSSASTPFLVHVTVLFIQAGIAVVLLCLIVGALLRIAKIAAYNQSAGTAGHGATQYNRRDNRRGFAALANSRS